MDAASSRVSVHRSAIGVVGLLVAALLAAPAPAAAACRDASTTPDRLTQAEVATAVECDGPRRGGRGGPSGDVGGGRPPGTPARPGPAGATYAAALGAVSR